MRTIFIYLIVLWSAVVSVSGQLGCVDSRVVTRTTSATREKFGWPGCDGGIQEYFLNLHIHTEDTRSGGCTFSEITDQDVTYDPITGDI